METLPSQTHFDRLYAAGEKVSWWAVPAMGVAIIISINIAFFYSHYAGRSVFPWDFFSSAYLGQTAAWFRDGSIINPPVWFPYGSMGFPAWWSIQSGGWNAPLQLLSVLNISYTIVNATIVQCVYVAAAGLGAFFLARMSGLTWPSATIAGVTYHFSSIFFSNQQHVDILRGAALLPYLLIFIHPAYLKNSSFRIFASALVIWQFLVSCYPGQIISGGVTALCALLFWIPTLNRSERRRYILFLSVSGICGLLASFAKWLPVIVEGTSSITSKTQVLGFLPQHIVTLLFEYGSVPFEDDITMRSIWVPPMLMLLFGYLRLSTVSSWLFCTLFTISIIVGSLNFWMPGLREATGILGISRLPHSDWRPTLQLSMAILGALAWQQATDKKRPLGNVLLVTAAGIIGVLLMGLTAWNLGYTFSNLLPDGATAVIFIIFTAFFLLTAHRLRSPILFLVSIAFAVVASYLQYVVHVPQTWQVAWSEDSERGTFGGLLSELATRRDWQSDRRPARQNFGVEPSVGLNYLAASYNRAWYEQDFSPFGYDNLNTSQWSKFFEAWRKQPTDSSLLGFAMHPSQAMLLSTVEKFNIDDASSCSSVKFFCSTVQGASASIQQFGLTGSIFSITAPSPIIMVENEIWYRGWRGRICDPKFQCLDINSLSVDSGLRGWAIPNGEWILTTEYSPPYRTISLSLALLGVIILFLYVILDNLWKVGLRFPRRTQLDRALSV